jgi:hypothetical protein
MLLRRSIKPVVKIDFTYCRASSLCCLYLALFSISSVSDSYPCISPQTKPKTKPKTPFEKRHLCLLELLPHTAQLVVAATVALKHKIGSIFWNWPYTTAAISFKRR